MDQPSARTFWALLIEAPDDVEQRRRLPRSADDESRCVSPMIGPAEATNDEHDREAVLARGEPGEDHRGLPAPERPSASNADCHAEERVAELPW